MKMQTLIQDIISIHAPREGSDAETTGKAEIVMTFQSTLPVKGATELLDLLVETAEFQSTLPVKGATLYPKHNFSCLSFQSTLPVKGATKHIRTLEW